MIELIIVLQMLITRSIGKISHETTRDETMSGVKRDSKIHVFCRSKLEQCLDLKNITTRTECLYE